MLFNIGYKLLILTYNEYLINDLINVFPKAKEIRKENIVVQCDLYDEIVFIKSENFEKKCMRDNWISYLIQHCKNEIICKIFKDSIIFHGSTVQYKSKNFLFLGMSKSGKSTAVFKMSCGNMDNVLCDDLTIYNMNTENIYLTDLNIIQLRDSYNDIKNIKLVNAWNTGDIYLIINERKKKITNLNIDYIILIKFNNEITKSKIDKLNKKVALKKIMLNIYNISTINFNDVVDICKKIPIYNIEYKEDLNLLLDNLIG